MSSNIIFLCLVSHHNDIIFDKGMQLSEEVGRRKCKETIMWPLAGDKMLLLLRHDQYMRRVNQYRFIVGSPFSTLAGYKMQSDQRQLDGGATLTNEETTRPNLSTLKYFCINHGHQRVFSI